MTLPLYFCLLYVSVSFSDLEHMPSDESNVKALSLIDQAVKMDQEKDLEGALTLYKSGISSYA